LRAPTKSSNTNSHSETTAMLNISPTSVTKFIDRAKYDSLRNAELRTSGKVLMRMIYIISAVSFIMLFLPWTQNIRTEGRVTTLRPDQRPQTIHSVIPGRIEKWFVMEGDYVKQGDTILFISEVKDDYFDPELLARTSEQLEAKEMSVKSYMEKVRAVDIRIDALIKTGQLKLEQARNKLKMSKFKVVSDSTDFEAAKLNNVIAANQLERMEKLYKDGLKSLTDLETRKVAMQKTQAEMISKENSLLAARNEVLNAEVELISIVAQYRDDVAKAESEKYSALSAMYDAEAVVTKLQNQYMNYSVRAGFYFITAPQNGYITQTVRSGIGETIKEGESLVTVMPADFDLAVEMYVKPIDLPLLEAGREVRIQFDGWPAIVFSGWPNTSYGTYGGVIFAIDNFTQPNGLYRVLVKPDPNDHPWPDVLRVGAATDNMVLLKDVPVWYEMWRQFNGFPPDYYKSTDATDSNKK
jgi:membrane fusion protein, adhesin transport system